MGGSAFRMIARMRSGTVVVIAGACVMIPTATLLFVGISWVEDDDFVRSAALANGRGVGRLHNRKRLGIALRQLDDQRTGRLMIGRDPRDVSITGRPANHEQSCKEQARN